MLGGVEVIRIRRKSRQKGLKVEFERCGHTIPNAVVATKRRVELLVLISHNREVISSRITCVWRLVPEQDG
jgi:hypothetical protein